MDTVVDVVFMRSRGGILTADAPDDKALIAGEYFEDFPKHLLGVETETSRGRYAVEGAFDRFPTFEARAECTACKAKSKPVIAVAAEVVKTQAMQFASDLGLRVKDYLASLGTGTTVISWSEIQIGLQDILLKHGNPWRWQELRDLADSGDQGAQSLLRAFTKAGQLVEALKTEPAVQPPKSDDPLILAGFLGKSGAGFTLGKLVELHQQMGGKLAADAIAKLLDEAGFLLDKDRYLPRWAYLSGDLWARYDDLPIGPEGDTRRSLLLAKIKPLVFEDIEFDPRQSWLPIEVVTGWINEDEQINAMDVVLGRDADDFIATYDESKGVDLEALIPWLNHTRFDPVGKAPLAIDDIPDEIQQEIQRIEAGGEKIPLSIRRALWEIFWLKRFRGWLNRSEQAREIATDAYNRTFRGYALPEFDAEPIEIFRWTKDPKLQLRPHQVKAVKARIQTRGGVLALAVGAGKTFTSLAIVAVGRQQGWIKRPVIVVPRSIVWQWYEEIERVLPDYRVGVVGSTRREAKSGPRKGQVIAETASALERSTVWLDFQAGYYDLVLLTDTSIATTRISDDDMYAYNRSRMGIRRSIRLFRQQALGKHEESLTERDRAFIENGSAAWSERVLQLKGREYDPGVEWSDLGIDFLVWDETGNIRNTWTPSPGFFGDPKYMGVSRGGGAQRAWQADYRAHSVRRKGGGILGLSGTVGENSPAEPYNLLHFIDPAILEKVGINNIDQFIARYVVIEERDVVAPTGERKLKSAVVGFKNLNELRHILHTHGSFVSHEEAGIQLPDSQELLIEVKMDAHQRRRYDEWRERAQLAIGVQSFEPEVLHRLGRPFDLERFERVCDAVREHWPIELELMLGLPGDDPASFRRTFEHAVEIADSVRVFWTLVLPDALLDRADPDLRIEFDPHTWLIESCAGWTPEDLRRELDHVKRVSLQHENAVVADHWAGFQVRRRPEQRPGPRQEIDSALDRAVRALDPELVEAIRQRVGGVGGWRLRTMRNQHDGLFFDLDSPEGLVTLEAVPAEPDRPRFEARDGVAYSHRGDVSHAEVARLRRIIEMVHPDALPLVSRG